MIRSLCNDLKNTIHIKLDEIESNYLIIFKKAIFDTTTRLTGRYRWLLSYYTGIGVIPRVFAYTMIVTILQSRIWKIKIILNLKFKNENLVGMHTAIFWCLNWGQPRVTSLYSPWCSIRIVDRFQVLFDGLAKNGVRDSPSICSGVDRRPAISKNVGAKSMFITCSFEKIEKQQSIHKACIVTCSIQTIKTIYKLLNNSYEYHWNNTQPVWTLLPE